MRVCCNGGIPLIVYFFLSQFVTILLIICMNGSFNLLVCWRFSLIMQNMVFCIAICAVLQSKRVSFSH